ncbi:putative knottin, scorpion toxin [Lupinus albus]|uniref:Putative knottin, scorpion toxin n=1 Tax=Lupinus albus TaxID=3870 RepID=A0A6A4QW27_LUPAL|nr:putative knottin, scorpion toxin [Lupinus albus]
MAFRTHQPFLFGILFIALILASGPTIIKAVELLDCEYPCNGGNKQCYKFCVSQGFKKGGSCSKSVCCCTISSEILDP